MLDDFGLHELVWGLADQTVSDAFVASPMDAQGRGILLRVREDGEPADLTGATAYLVWTHRQTGKRGTTEFGEVDASVGTFSVHYPAAMCEAAGIVDASVMLSLGDERFISTRLQPGGRHHAGIRRGDDRHHRQERHAVYAL